MLELGGLPSVRSGPRSLVVVAKPLLRKGGRCSEAPPTHTCSPRGGDTAFPWEPAAQARSRGSCVGTELALQRSGWWLCECVRLSVFSLHCVEFSSKNESLEDLLRNICKAESPGLHAHCVLLAPRLHSLPRRVCPWVSCRKSDVKTCRRLPCCFRARSPKFVRYVLYQ